MGAQPATAYPTEEQYERWKREAEKRGISVSEFIACMVEAGLKKFDASVAPDEDYEDLRRQRSNLKDELDRARERIEELEDQLYQTERHDIEEFVEENPGSDFEEIVNHVRSTASIRTLAHIEEMEGTAIREEEEQFYPVEA